MAEHRDLNSMSKILDNVEEDLRRPAQAPAPVATRAPPSVVESFAPQKYRNAADTVEQVQQDLRRAVADTESRFKAIVDELKRITG